MVRFVAGDLCCAGCTADLDMLVSLPAGTKTCPTCGGGDLRDAETTWKEILARGRAAVGKLDKSMGRQILVSAIRQARKNCLLAEFRAGYRRYRAGGDSVSSACWYALYDWDMNDIENLEPA